jgi:hypothetical protein
MRKTPAETALSLSRALTRWKTAEQRVSSTGVVGAEELAGHFGEDRAMGKASLALVGGIVLIALVQGVPSVVWAGAEDDERPTGLGIRGAYRPWSGAFDVQVVVAGRPVPQESVGGERRVEAVAGADYELRLTNPLPQRVAVAVSIDGLNVIDARHTSAWDASKWVIHPHETLTLSGWQVSSERARRFYFTTERDAYATRIGRPGDFGVISAVFYRERGPLAQIIARHPAVPERGDSVGRATEAPATGASVRAAPGGDGGSRGRFSRGWRRDDRAATGIGNPVPSEVQAVSMELEPHPVAVVTLHYDFRPAPPRPIIVPGFAPEPRERGWNTRREGGRFAPEP